MNDLTAQMIRMRDAGAELVLNFHESFELLYRPLPRINYRPVFAGNWGLSSLKVLEIVGAEAIEGTVMGQALDLNEPKARRFDERMRQEYGSAYRWPVVAALGYDAGQVMFRAVERVGRPDPLAIREALETLDGVEAVSATPARPFAPGRPRVPGPRARLPRRVAERAGGAAGAAVTNRRRERRAAPLPPGHRPTRAPP